MTIQYVISLGNPLDKICPIKRRVFRIETITQFYREPMANYPDKCDGPSCKLCADYGREEDNNIPGSQEGTDGEENIIYLIKSEEGVPYVGKTTQKLKHRMAQHRCAIKAGHGDGKKFIEYYQTHDFEKAAKTVLCYCTSEEELPEMEQLYIDEHNSLNKGLNSKRATALDT